MLEQRGASFFHELVAASGLLPTQVEQALGELAGLGLVTSDSFAGLRALITPSSKRKPLGGGAPAAPDGGVRHRERGAVGAAAADGAARQRAEPERVELRRPRRCSAATAWCSSGCWPARPARRRGASCSMVYRRLEARGEIRGGRFVAGMSGEQFALPEAVGQLRAIRRQAARRADWSRSARPIRSTSPASSRPGERVAAVGRNRILYRDGVPVLALEGGEAKPLVAGEAAPSPELVQALVRKQLTPALRAQLAMSGAPAGEAVPGKRSARRPTKKAAAKEV